MSLLSLITLHETGKWSESFSVPDPPSRVIFIVWLFYLFIFFPHLSLPTAEEQVHEKVAPRCRGVERAGRRGGLPGNSLRGVRSSAAGRHARGSNRGPSAHKVENHSGKNDPPALFIWSPWNEFFCFVLFFLIKVCANISSFCCYSGFSLSCWGPKGRQSPTMKLEEPLPPWCQMRYFITVLLFLSCCIYFTCVYCTI